MGSGKLTLIKLKKICSGLSIISPLSCKLCFLHALFVILFLHFFLFVYKVQWAVCITSPCNTRTFVREWKVVLKSSSATSISLHVHNDFPCTSQYRDYALSSVIVHSLNINIFVYPAVGEEAAGSIFMGSRISCFEAFDQILCRIFAAFLNTHIRSVLSEMKIS
jgi:hypothetical protein